MLTPVTPARRAAAGPLTRFILALGLAIMLGSHFTAPAVLAQSQTTDLIVIKNAAGAVTARLTYDGYWGLGNAFHPNAGTISLTAGRKYWSVKSATGAVLFAIDCESGEAWSVGPASEGLSTIDPAGSSFSAKNANGTTVFSISPDGAINVIGGIFDWFIQNILEPPEMNDPGLPVLTDWQSVYNRFAELVSSEDSPLRNVDIVVPEPQAQMRIYCATDSANGPVGTDVSYKKWRMPFVKDGTAVNYDLRTAYRWYDTEGVLETRISSSTEDRVGIEDDYSVRYDTGYDPDQWVTVRAGNWDHDTTHSSVTNWPLFPIPWVYPFSMAANDQEDIMYHKDGGQHWPLDYKTDGDVTIPHDCKDALTAQPQTALFLYDVKFFHPCRIPRKSTDSPVWLGCALWPGNTPGLESIKLQIYDPYTPNNSREWVVTGGSWWVVTGWDGYLFENGDSTRPVRVGGNDVVMKAWVTFKTTRFGEALTPDEYVPEPFTEPRLIIFSPNKAAFGNYRFVFNEKNEHEGEMVPGYCEFTVSGTTNFENQTDDPLMQWTLQEMNGSTLTPATASERTGWCVNLRYTNLPPQITDFGFKTLTLTHPTVKPYKVQVQVEIYFPSIGKNWPGAAPCSPWYNPNINVPPARLNPMRYTPDNAYHYYSQIENGKAVKNCPWKIDGCATSLAALPGYPLNAPDPVYPYHVPQMGSLEQPYRIPSYSDWRGTNATVVLSGLQLWGVSLFAWAARHEVQHHNDYMVWWGSSDATDSQRDSDEDYMIDSVEDEEPPPPIVDPKISIVEGGPYYRGHVNTHSAVEAGIALENDSQAHCLFSTDMSDWTQAKIEYEIHERNTYDWGYPGARWHDESSCNPYITN